MTFLFYVAFLACATAGAALVVRHDMYDREPPVLVLLTVLVGFLVTPLLGAFEDFLLYAVSSTPSIALISLVAGVVEEGARAALVVLFALAGRHHFNDPADGITYGSLLGVGMAAWETAVFAGEDLFPWEGALARELVRLYGHVVLGGIAGYAAGPLRMGDRAAAPALALGMLTAMALHFLVDLGALIHATRFDGRAAGTAIVIGAVVAATLLHGGLTVIAVERSRTIFAPGSARRLVTWPLDFILGPEDPSRPR